MSAKDQNSKSLGRLRDLGPRVITLAVPYWRTLLVGLLALALASGINLLFPYLIREAANGRMGLSLERDLTKLVVLLIGLFALQALFFFIRHYAFTSAGFRVVTDLRRLLYRAMVVQDVAFYDSSRVGDLLSRLASDTQVVQRAITNNISIALRYLIQVAGGLVLMLVISVRLSLIILLVIPVVVGISALWSRRLRSLSRRMQRELGDANVTAEETLSAVRTVKIFAGEAYELRRYAAANDLALKTGLERTAVAAAFSSGMVFVIHSSIALVIGYGGHLVLNSEMTIGDLTAFILYGIIVAVSFGFLAQVWDEFLAAVGASERIFEILDGKPRVVSVSNAKPVPRDRGASVAFENVAFSYPARPEAPVLRGLTFEIKEGSTVAIVGPSGAGKSTVASLIPRFYDVLEGTILYCGVPVAELDLQQLRADLSAVAQDPQVFSVSIGENIRYGRLDASTEDVIEAAKLANIHSFIETLPDGYETAVGDKGVQLSGGQRQRLAIARAVLKNPRMLILDEATSALDSDNERLVQQALQNLMAGRTTLVIAHRLSTVQHADLVIVLKDGRIEQSGTHAELAGLPGIYRDLVEHQLL